MKIKFTRSSIHMEQPDQCFSAYSYQANQSPSNSFPQSWRKRIFRCLHLVEPLMRTGLVLPLPVQKTTNDFLKSSVKSFSLSPCPFRYIKQYNPSFLPVPLHFLIICTEFILLASILATDFSSKISWTLWYFHRAMKIL